MRITTKGMVVLNIMLGLLLAAKVADAQINNRIDGLTPITSTSAEGSHVLKAGAGTLYSLYVTTGATAGFLMTFNATSAPADGAVTPIECIQVPANTTLALSFGGGPPDVYSTGIVAVFSSTGCFTKTVSNTAFFKARVI